jgi:hypothetical protein
MSQIAISPGYAGKMVIEFKCTNLNLFLSLAVVAKNATVESPWGL